jgi:hypothetical protein
VLWVGFVVMMLDYAWFLPQLWVSGYSQSQPYKMPMYRGTAVMRSVSWVTLTASVFLIRDTQLLFIVFIVTFASACIGSGLSGLSFLEVVSKTIPPHRRGPYFAWRLSLAGVMSIGASVIVQWMLSEASPFEFPYNFGVLFLAATFLFFFGWGSFWIVREPPDEVVLPRASFLSQLKRSLGLVRADPRFQRFLWLRSMLVIAGTVLPFYALYVQTQLGGSLGMIGIYLGTFKGANLLSNIALGRVSARWGYHRLMQISTGSGLLMTLMMLALVGLAATAGVPSWLASWWLVPVFVVSGIRESAVGISGQSLLLEIAPQNNRSLYLGFTNTFLGVVVLVASLSGVLVETVGFAPLLILSLVAYLLAVVAAMGLRGTVHVPQNTTLNKPP